MQRAARRIERGTTPCACAFSAGGGSAAAAAAAVSSSSSSGALRLRVGLDLPPLLVLREQDETRRSKDRSETTLLVFVGKGVVVVVALPWGGLVHESSVARANSGMHLYLHTQWRNGKG